MSPGLQSQTALLYNYSVCHQGRILCLRYNQGGGSKKTMKNHTIVWLHNLIPISNFNQFASRNAFMNTGMKMIIFTNLNFLKRQREKIIDKCIGKMQTFRSSSAIVTAAWFLGTPRILGSVAFKTCNESAARLMLRRLESSNVVISFLLSNAISPKTVKLTKTSGKLLNTGTNWSP